ncbi:MAG: hypothetical protein VB131_00735 [Burkholderia gladioli]
MVSITRAARREAAGRDTASRILRLLADGPAPRFVLVRVLGLSEASAYRSLADLHRESRVHVVAWVRRARSTAWVPVYAQGAGSDAPKPERLSAAQRARRHRQALREHHVRVCANPFAVAAGLVAVPPCAVPGRVYQQVT